ncbi:hypothetical protein M8C21_022298, partial [Ambrosia artemisiifolia]
MVSSFFKPIVFNHATFQAAEIIEDVKDSQSYVITNGWNKFVEENDFIIFELLKDRCF